MKEQGCKLMEMISIAVRGLDRIEKLVPAVQSLGARHADYGARDNHYQAVGEALLRTLDQGLGDEFTTETKSAWEAVYELLSNTMKNASQQSV